MSLIVLLTDFGNRDYFVGVMKGVISTMNPLVRVADLTHEIEPRNVREAAFVLWASRKFFPEDSILVSVVDPGVGGDRKIICGRLNDQIFIAPDNGLLDYVAAEANELEFYEVSNKKFFLPNVSSTFHGRDIFAPVSAHISRGIRLSELGPRFNYPRVEPFYREITKGKNEGQVIYQDRFGNVFTNFVWDDSLLVGGSRVKIGPKVTSKFYLSYSESHTRGLICVKGSSGLVEVAIDCGNASKVLHSKMGTKVILISK